MFEHRRALLRSVPESMEPRPGPRVIRKIAVFETEIVEIQWRLKDGSFFYHRVIIPPKAVREARWRREECFDGKEPA